jgi:nitronate monooxygenase
MVIDCSFKDIVPTRAITGALANKLRPSLEAAGIDPDTLDERKTFDLHYAEKQPKAWKNIWSAGHGVGRIRESEGVAEIVAKLKAEYVTTIASEVADPWVQKYMPSSSESDAGHASERTIGQTLHYAAGSKRR